MGKYLRARFEEHEKTYQKAGSREKLNYIMTVDKNGRKQLKESLNKIFINDETKASSKLWRALWGRKN